jgi:hypothetical protein
MITGSEGISVVSSNLSISNTEFSQISNSNDEDFILGLLDSQIVIENVTYYDSTSIFMNLRSSELEIKNLTSINTNSQTNFMKLSNLYKVSLSKL